MDIGSNWSPAGISFTPDGLYMAAALRRNGKDSVCVLACSNWSMVSVCVASDQVGIR